MELQTSQVDLDSIQVKADFPEPNADQITYLAHSIAALGGLIQVPVVKPIDLETYELIHGYFEYRAYLKAREIDSSLPDRMRVFIVTKKNAKPIQQQIDVFEELARSGERGSDDSIPPDLAIKLSNLAAVMEGFKQDIEKASRESQATILDAIDERLPKPLPIMEAFNHINESKVAQQALDKLGSAVGNSRSKKIIENLKRYTQKRQIDTFEKVLEAVGKDDRGRRLLTEKTLLKVIDAWGK